MDYLLYDEFMMVRGLALIVSVCLCAGVVAVCYAYPSFYLPFEKLAEAPVIITCIVQETSRDPSASGPKRGVVAAHAMLLVLRSFNPSAVVAGERIRLDYEALPALPPGGQGGSGPDVPPLVQGAVFALGLKPNPRPSFDGWRLVADEGQSLVIPAMRRAPPFAGQPRNGREFLLNEIASVLITGTRAEVHAEVSYVSRQKTIASEVMHLLESKLAADADRWALIAGSLLSSLGVPRPTVADLRNGKGALGQDFSGSLITALLRKLGSSEKAKEKLIHQLLTNSDIASWGVGITLQEFAQEPSLVRELRGMLESRSPGSLYVAFHILIAGQKSILGDATALALHYISAPGAKPSDRRVACLVVRDFGTDEQFGRLVSAIRQSQYEDRHRYDELWSATIWSDNNRENEVLEILLADQRVVQGNQRYSDIARGELARIKARK